MQSFLAWTCLFWMISKGTNISYTEHNCVVYICVVYFVVYNCVVYLVVLGVVAVGMWLRFQWKA